MELKPIYRVRFRYPDGWEVGLEGPLGREERHRAPDRESYEQADVELMFQVSELIWSAPPD